MDNDVLHRSKLEKYGKLMSGVTMAMALLRKRSITSLHVPATSLFSCPVEHVVAPKLQLTLTTSLSSQKCASRLTNQESYRLH